MSSDAAGPLYPRAFERIFFNLAVGVSERRGEASILRRYCSISANVPIIGFLQQTWNPSWKHPPPMAPFYAWNLRDAEKAHAMGVRQVSAIGSPVLYLEDEAVVSQRRLLAMPPRKSAWTDREFDHRAYAAQLNRLRSDGFEEIDGCLFWRDLTESHHYESNEIRVVSSGHDSDPEFLQRNVFLLRSCEYVTSPSLGTSLIYALAGGRKGFLHGAADGEPLRKMGTDGARFECLLYSRFGDRSHRDLGLAELGSDAKRSPEELIELFGWPDANRAAQDPDHEIAAYFEFVSGRLGDYPGARIKTPLVFYVLRSGSHPSVWTMEAFESSTRVVPGLPSFESTSKIGAAFYLIIEREELFRFRRRETSLLDALEANRACAFGLDWDTALELGYLLS